MNDLGTTTTRKELREIASGNITIEEIFNRAKFDDGFPVRRFSALLEHPNRQPLCYFYTWENGVCKYGNKCRYLHDPNIQLRVLDDRPIVPKSTMPNLSRCSLSDISIDSPLHSIAFIEYQGRIVWFRDGGKNSGDLWEKCMSKIATRRRELRAIASSIAPESVHSAPESVKLIELLREENFNSLFTFLPVKDMFNMLVAFASSSYIRHESRTCMLSNTVWDSAISNKWGVPFTHHDNPIQIFMSLAQSTTEAHAFLTSSTTGLFTHGNSLPDTNPCTGIRALTESTEIFPGKTILISDEGVPVTDIRFSESLIATANGSEVSLVRRGDLVKVSTSPKYRLSADRVTMVPPTSGNNWLLHAGQSDIFLRDMDEPGLKLVKKISLSNVGPCCSLDATSQSVFVGYAKQGLYKVDLETGMCSSPLLLDGLGGSKMWTDDGRLHVYSSNSEKLGFWDLRMKDRISILPNGPSCVFGFAEYSSPVVVMGTTANFSGVDIRMGKILWSIPTETPVTHLSMTNNIVATFTGTPSNAFSQIVVHDLTRDTSQPTRIGEHSIPFRMSAVGFSCDGHSASGGCVFAVKSRPKRSGRGGDDGILCVGGSGFMNVPAPTNHQRRVSTSAPRVSNYPPTHKSRSG